jgi:hypothetical protein
MSIAAIGAIVPVTEAPVVPAAPSIADVTADSPGGILAQSFAGALLAGALAPPGALADDFEAPPTPPPVAPVNAVAAYGRIDVFA